MTEKSIPRKRAPFEGKLSELTGKILKAFFQLHQEMGYGFSYLKATEIEVGLLLNFGSKPEFRRKVYDNPLKGSLAWLKNS